MTVLQNITSAVNFDQSMVTAYSFVDLQKWERDIFEVVNFVFLCGTVSVLGITGNIINIVIFWCQGFANTVNISFFGMAISDLFCLLALLWVSVCLNPLVVNAGAPWVPDEFQNLTGAWPHITCGRITSYITVYVTAERCMCIIKPMKVKQIITRTRTTVAICLIYGLNILCLVPEYATIYLDWHFFPGTNKTLLAMTFTSDRGKFLGLVFFLSTVTGMISFLAIIFFTTLLVVKLKEASEWRIEVSSGGIQSGLTSRDKKTMKMIVVIACVLIICYTPGAILTLATFVEPEFNIKRRYVNIGMAMWSFGFVFQGVNSSVNVFLYYKMSLNYRQQFQERFGKCMQRTSEVENSKSTNNKRGFTKTRRYQE